MRESPQFHPHSKAGRPAVEALLDLSFGPARQQRTASLLRAGASRIDQASFRLLANGALLGSVECWELQWHGQGQSRRIAMLGPIAVHPDHRAHGIGAQLMERALAELDRLQLAVMLIGDEPYYGRWGFSPRHTGGWVLPGPVERNRLLLRAPVPQQFAGAATFSAISPAIPSIARPTARSAA